MLLKHIKTVEKECEELYGKDWKLSNVMNPRKNWGVIGKSHKTEWEGKMADPVHMPNSIERNHTCMAKDCTSALLSHGKGLGNAECNAQ